MKAHWGMFRAEIEWAMDVTTFAEFVEQRRP